MWKSKLNLWLTPGHSCNSLPEIKKLQIQIESLCHSNFLALIVHKMFFKSTWVFFYLGEIQRLAIALISSPLYWKNPKIKGWGEKPKTSSIFFFYSGGNIYGSLQFDIKDIQHFFLFRFPFRPCFWWETNQEGKLPAMFLTRLHTEMHCGQTYHSQILFSTLSCTIFSVTSNETIDLLSVQDNTFLMQDAICIREIKHHRLDMWSHTCCTYLSFDEFIVQCLFYFQVVTMEAELWETVVNLKMIPSNYDSYLNNCVF